MLKNKKMTDIDHCALAFYNHLSPALKPVPHTAISRNIWIFKIYIKNFLPLKKGNALIGLFVNLSQSNKKVLGKKQSFCLCLSEKSHG